MRVVFLTHNYPRAPGDIAGAFLHPLAVALHERGIDVRVVAPSDGGKGGRDKLDGVPVLRVRYASAENENIAYTGNMLGALRSPRGWLALGGLFRALRAGALEELEGATAGVVHAQWWIPGGLAAPHRYPLVVTCHGTDVQLLERSALARQLAAGPLRRARVVTTVSKSLAEILRNRLHVAVALDDVLPMPLTQTSRPASRGGDGVVVIGRLSAQKRVHLAIEAYALMRQQGVVVPMTIVGDGVECTRLKALVTTLHLNEQVRFAGALPPNQVPDVLATADLLLMPALGEGLGLAAVEGLMQGVPVVTCSDGGGLLDVVPTSGGGAIVAATPQAIADAAVKLLRDHGARSAALRAGDVFRHRLEPGVIADRCLGWYKRALA